MPPTVPPPSIRSGSPLGGSSAKAGATAKRLTIRVETSFLVMVLSSRYRRKNWPLAAGAFEPWILLWQFRQARSTSRVLTALLSEPGGLPKQAELVGS